jgi:hypothetical protein
MTDQRAGERTGLSPRLLLVLAVLGAALLMVVVVVLRQERQPVVLIGDSITANLAAAARSALHDSYSVELDGRPGYRVDQLVESAQNASRFPFRQVVVNLGTNDVMTPDQDLAASLGAMAQIIASFPEVDCIHVVTVNEQMVSDEVDAGARASRFNDGLQQLAADDDRVNIIDWNEIVASYEAEHPGEMITTDTVHPDETGNRLLAEAYEDALDACDDGLPILGRI